MAGPATSPASSRKDPLRDHPSLVLLLDRILEELKTQGRLGVLTVTVVRGPGDGPADRWRDYEAVLGQISLFFDIYRGRRIRQSDVVIDPIVAGNTFVVLVGPPRGERALERSDVLRARSRLSSELNVHLSRRLSVEAVERYGVYVGGSLARHDPLADSRRVIYRGLEESLADALDRTREEESQQNESIEGILREGDVATVYQPVIDIFEQRIIGFEALTRIPQGQFRSPDAMFRAATEVGTLWSLERLCRKRALESLPRMSSSETLFINLEPKSFYDPQLRGEDFLKQIEEAGLDPRRLVLELTEHAAVEDFETMRRVLGEVRSVGYGLALDDVGSGYAGLQTIAEIRPDYLKVDMTLIRNVHTDPIKRELISTICRFADSTDVTLVAEGVESQEELESLASAGVRRAQGFLFARPDSPPETPDWRLLSCVGSGS